MARQRPPAVVITGNQANAPIKDEDNDEDRYARLCSFGAYFVLDPDGL